MNKIQVGGFIRISKREFETVVNAFRFYNCNGEMGRYPAFYVKGV